MSLPRVALYAGFIGVLIASLAIAANLRVSPDFELLAELSGVELTIGREDPVEPILPALSASKVTFDLIQSVEVPSARLPPAARDCGPVTILRTSPDGTGHGAVNFRGSLPKQTITVQPVRLQREGRLRLSLDSASEGRISALLTKIAEPVSIVAPGDIIIDAIQPSTLMWRTGSGGKVKLAATADLQAIPTVSHQSVLISAEGIELGILPNLLSDRTRYSRVAFQSPDVVDGHLRSTLIGGLSLKFPALPDYRPLLGTTSDLLILQSSGQLRFKRFAVANGGLAVTLIGSADVFMHGSVDLRPTALDVAWSDKRLVLLATAVFAMIGALIKVLDLRDKLLKLQIKPKEYRD